MFFDSLVAWAEMCVEHVRLQTLLWWLGRRGADQEDLIICVAFLTIQKLWGPLTCDDFRVASIASWNRLRFTSLLGLIFGDFGGPHGFPNSIFNAFLAMLFLIAFRNRFLVDFWKLRAEKISIFLKENNDFYKISFFDKAPKNIKIRLHFRRPKRRKIQ